MTLSTMRQAELMRKEWPMFKALHRTRWGGPLGRATAASVSDLHDPSFVVAREKSRQICFHTDSTSNGD